MSALELREGEHYFRRARVTHSAALVDARAYYKALYRAALEAENYVVLAGWQFDTEVALLRGDDAVGAPLPVTLLAFLESLCQRRPNLRIFILAWDYSFIYALEREWLQALKFATKTCSALRFEFDTHPRFNASHHQKFVVVDGVAAFVGGLDVCDERWDDRGHAAGDPLRVNVLGEASRPNHEVQSLLVGEAAQALSELFCERWRDAGGEELRLPEPASTPHERFEPVRLTDGEALPLSAREVMLSRTAVIPGQSEMIQEIRAAYTAVFAAARELIYIETQYFTSRSMAAALLARLHASDMPKLTVVIVMPRGADSSKEKFALGEAQDMALGALEAAAAANGHELRVLCSCIDGDAAQGTTFIHSKLLIVDDQVLSIGSANMTERSMGFDSELAVLWQAEANSPLSREIAQVRASLLAEHAGRESSEFIVPSELCARIDERIANETSRLRRCHFEPHPSNPLKTLIFDPGGPTALPDDFELPTPNEDRERLSRGSIRLREELSRRSEVPPPPSATPPSAT